jgi:hypothetical protein
MEVVLQNNLILVRTNFRMLNQSWMRDFLTVHSNDMLFLPRSVLIFKNQSLVDSRKQFLDTLSRFHAQINDFCEKFFNKSLLRLSNTPIKVELVSMQEIQRVSVDVYARDRHTVEISLFHPNSWVMSYLQSQLHMHVKESGPCYLVIDVKNERAKKRLERALSKRHILHYEMQYKYDANFLQKLYEGFSVFDSEENEDESVERIINFYNILGCPVGASQELLKKSYKKLARVYHPDRIYYERPNMVSHYTQKFQLIQEAYSVLKEVS